MNKFLLKVITILKKNLDKLYYSQYTLQRETLIREMFPWIQQIWEYKHIDIYIRNHNITEIDDLIKTIYSFYRWEVNRFILEWKIENINNLQWLLDFIYSIRSFQEEILRQNNLSDNT